MTHKNQVYLLIIHTFYLKKKIANLCLQTIINKEEKYFFKYLIFLNILNISTFPKKNSKKTARQSRKLKSRCAVLHSKRSLVNTCVALKLSRSYLEPNSTGCSQTSRIPSEGSILQE